MWSPVKVELSELEKRKREEIGKWAKGSEGEREDGVDPGGDGSGKPPGGERHGQRAQCRHRGQEGLHSAQPWQEGEDPKKFLPRQVY